MSKLIETPYGRKTPELLCKAMDALVLQPQLEAENAALQKSLREAVLALENIVCHERIENQYRLAEAKRVIEGQLT